MYTIIIICIIFFIHVYMYTCLYIYICYKCVHIYRHEQMYLLYLKFYAIVLVTYIIKIQAYNFIATKI